MSGKNVVPHGTSDGVSDGRTETTKETPDGVDNSDFLVSDGNHDGKLTAGGEEGRSETNKDLSESKDTRVGGGVSEWNQQSGTEQDNRYTSGGRPLEITGMMNPPCDKWAERRRSEREGVEDVSSVCDALPVYDDQVRIEVPVPAEDGKEHGTIKQARADNGGVPKVMPGQELEWRILGFPDVENREKAETEDDAGDNIRGLPALRSVGLETERQHKETPCAHEEDDTEDCTMR